jgi:hypothetical protein
MNYVILIPQFKSTGSRGKYQERNSVNHGKDTNHTEQSDMVCVREVLYSILHRGTGFLRLLFIVFESVDAITMIEPQIRKPLLATKSSPSHSISLHYTCTSMDPG